MGKSRAQVGLEYAMIAVFVLIIILPATYFFFTYSKATEQRLTDSQVGRFAHDVINNAEALYYQGYPSQMVLDAQIPPNVEAISFNRDSGSGNSELVIRVRTAQSTSGYVDYAYMSKVDLVGVFGAEEITPGQRKIKLSAASDTSGSPHVIVAAEAKCTASGTYDLNSDKAIDANDYAVCTAPSCFNKTAAGICTGCDYDANCIVDNKDLVYWNMFSGKGGFPSASISKDGFNLVGIANDPDGNLIEVAFYSIGRESGVRTKLNSCVISPANSSICTMTYNPVDTSDVYLYVEGLDNKGLTCSGNPHSKGMGVMDCGLDDYVGDYFVTSTDCAPGDPTRWDFRSCAIDSDGDGKGTGTFSSVCSGNTCPQGYSDDANDCAASDPARWQTLSCFVDGDGDGYSLGTSSNMCKGASCSSPAGHVGASSGTDCNDANASIWAYKYTDSDGDGWGLPSNVCTGDQEGFIDSPGTDCNDTNPTVWQPLNCYKDIDSDYVGAGALVSVCRGSSCTSPVGYSANGTDCNDTNGGKFQIKYRDQDFDTYITSQSFCVGYEPGYSSTGAIDCNDTNEYAFALQTCYVDNDRDGYGTGTAINMCTGIYCNSTPGYSALNTDCNDTNSSAWGTGYVDQDGDTYTSGSSICAKTASTPNGNDCNDTNSTVWQSKNLYRDADNDLYTTGGVVSLCVGSTDPVGWKATASGNDCNDSNMNLWQNFSCYVDKDNDGFTLGSLSAVCKGASCSSPAGHSANSVGTDCNDNSATRSVDGYTDSDLDSWRDSNTFATCNSPGVPGSPSIDLDCAASDKRMGAYCGQGHITNLHGTWNFLPDGKLDVTNGGSQGHPMFYISRFGAYNDVTITAELHRNSVNSEVGICKTRTSGKFICYATNGQGNALFWEYLPPSYNPGSPSSGSISGNSGYLSSSQLTVLKLQFSGTTIRAKQWEKMNPEPTSWGMTISNYPAYSGYIGGYMYGTIPNTYLANFTITSP